jgi:hypothetical protein
MELLLLTCSISAAVDQSTNSASIFNMLEQVAAPSFPAGIPQMVVFSLVSKLPSEPQVGNLRLLITLDSQPIPLLDAPMGVDFQGKLRTRVIANLQAMLVPSPGLITVSVLEGARTLGSWKIDVMHIGQAAAPPPVASSAATSPPQVVTQTTKKAAKKSVKKKAVKKKAATKKAARKK